MFIPIAFTLLIGGVFTVSLAIGIAWTMGAHEQILVTLTTKSITTPIAIMVSNEVGGLSSIAAASVLFTGVLGAIVGPAILSRMNASDDVKGFTLGLTSHAIGTAKALEISDECGAFSALAMGLMGIATSMLVPIIFLLIS